MDPYLYERLHMDFVRLRYLTSGMDEDAAAFDGILADLECMLPLIGRFGTEDEQNVLGYAVRTAVSLGKAVRADRPRCRLFRSRKHSEAVTCLNLFCDAVHNLCELFTEDTWEKDAYYRIFLAPFRKRYGDAYFREVLYFFGVSADAS